VSCGAIASGNAENAASGVYAIASGVHIEATDLASAAAKEVQGLRRSTLPHAPYDYLQRAQQEQRRASLRNDHYRKVDDNEIDTMSCAGSSTVAGEELEQLEASSRVPSSNDLIEAALPKARSENDEEIEAKLEAAIKMHVDCGLSSTADLLTQTWTSRQEAAQLRAVAHLRSADRDVAELDARLKVLLHEEELVELECADWTASDCANCEHPDELEANESEQVELEKESRECLWLGGVFAGTRPVLFFDYPKEFGRKNRDRLVNLQSQ
jgi:hypothetical protein